MGKYIFTCWLYIAIFPVKASPLIRLLFCQNHLNFSKLGTFGKKSFHSFAHQNKRFLSNNRLCGIMSIHKFRRHPNSKLKLIIMEISISLACTSCSASGFGVLSATEAGAEDKGSPGEAVKFLSVFPWLTHLVSTWSSLWRYTFCSSPDSSNSTQCWCTFLSYFHFLAAVRNDISYDQTDCSKLGQIYKFDQICEFEAWLIARPPQLRKIRSVFHHRINFLPRICSISNGVMGHAALETKNILMRITWESNLAILRVSFMAFSVYQPHFTLRVFDVSSLTRTCTWRFSSTCGDGVVFRHGTEWAGEDFL